MLTLNIYCLYIKVMLMYSFVSVSAYFFLQRFFFVRLSRTTLQCDRVESHAMQQSFGSFWIIQSTVWLRQDGDLAGVFFLPTRWQQISHYQFQGDVSSVLSRLLLLKKKKFKLELRILFHIKQ